MFLFSSSLVFVLSSLRCWVMVAFLGGSVGRSFDGAVGYLMFTWDGSIGAGFNGVSIVSSTVKSDGLIGGGIFGGAVGNTSLWSWSLVWLFGLLTTGGIAEERLSSLFRWTTVVPSGLLTRGWTEAGLNSLCARGGGAAELLGWLVRWGAVELLGWLLRWWTTVELLGWLVWVGLRIGMVFLLVGVSGGRSLMSMLSIIVQCGIGGFCVFVVWMVAGVVGGQEALASFLHWAI